MQIAIIGCGNMGSSLAERLSPPHHLFLHDRDWNWTKELAHQVNGEACQSLREAIEKPQFIFLAVKPDNLKEVAPLILPYLKKDQVLISLLAGTSLVALKQDFPDSILVRIMPNLAIRYGAGVVGLVDSPEMSSPLKQQLQELLSPLGGLYWLKEDQIDAFTSLVGSGPAFILALIESVIEASIAMGFHRSDAQELTLRMWQGSLTLMQKTGQHPAELKWQIASPNGTTIAGLRALERGNVRSGVIETFLAAYQRAEQLTRRHASSTKLK